ncbi:NACHT, LRR and PYD domains-containing protein 12-like [Astyanax mexicanus]|uniref:NACHT, LRR and PYD domains-containing protein 12-like n=1 Tax=Astyanax mexicanus TaxID=7994 RepID=A0A8B9H1F6_ASTMX|nr:NACHT, LRR and PYD domains-containing protein 12-like [Astyanax mexicanus]
MDPSAEEFCDIQTLHKEALRNAVLNSTQASTLLGGQSINDIILNHCYTPLSASVGEKACVEESEEWETLEAVLSRESGEGHGGRKVMLCGGAGMGKTTGVEQLIWDWAAGTRLQHYTFLLRVCVDTLFTSKKSLEGLLLTSHAHFSTEALAIVLQRPAESLLLVLDGLDRFQNLLSECPPSDELVNDPQQPVGGAVLLHSLLEGFLLPGASILLTSREPILDLESLQCVHLLGFSQDQRRTFVQRFFQNEAKAEQILHHCEQAVGMAELCVCPTFFWMLCCVYKECKDRAPQTLTELCCIVTHKILQEHSVSMEAGKQLLCGLGKLADHCTSLTQTSCSSTEVFACGLQPFLGSAVLSAFLRLSGGDISSDEATFSFLSPVFREFVSAAAFYLDPSAPHSGQDEGGIPEEGEGLLHVFLAGLSDPAQRTLLESSVGTFSSGRLSEFHQWLMSSVTEVLPGFEKEKHWRMFQLLHHAHSPVLVREGVGSCQWRTVSYSGLRVADCVALAYIVCCLGEMEHLNLYRSKLTEKQMLKLLPVFQLARSVNLSQSHLSSDGLRHLAQAMMDGQTTALNLSYSKLGDEAVKTLCPALKHSNLQTLNLRVCNLTPGCCEALGQMLSGSKLCVLDLGGNDLQDQGLSQLISAVGTSSCRLQDLSIGMCSLSGACVAVLSSALNSSLSELKILNLRDNSLAEDTLELLSQALQTGRSSLNTLTLFDCELTDSCCPSIAAILQSHNCHLTELDLSVNELGQSGALVIFDTLTAPQCPLKKLCMVRCELTEQVFSVLGSVLVSATSRLKELDIGINPVGDAGAKHLWKALKHPNCKLQHLDLEMISLTDASVDELCEAVAASTSLTSLILKNNGLTDLSVPRLVKLVQDRPIMKELNLQYNDFSEDVFELMDVCPRIQY